MQSIWQDIRLIFSRPKQGLMRIIVANIAVFLVLMTIKVVLLLANQGPMFESLLEHVTLSSQPNIVLTEPWTVLSYFFVHVEVFHLLFNMLFLYWFGTIIQDFIGTQRIVQLYFWGGIAGAIAYLLMVNNFAYFIQKGPTFLNGASAGVFAIVVSAATIKPSYRVHLFLFGDVQIKYISAFYVIWSFIETTGSNAGGNIAHLGGAFMGFMYGYFINKPAKKHVFIREEKVFSVVHVAQKKVQELTTDPEKEDVVEEELNQILDKISTSGYESLSKYEKRRLFKASQKND